MNRIDSMFHTLKAEGKKALITFITAGDPTIRDTERMVLEMERQGADLVELGIPFSDPIAEGPVIQEANLRALKHDIGLDVIFAAVRRLREKTQIPLVFLMYYNSVLNYGPGRFFQTCAESGVDGVIIPDLPFEESDEIAEYTKANDVHQISLVSPTSSSRLEKICAAAKGFLYCVSSLGVTGMRETIRTDLAGFFQDISRHCSIPTCIGFGISSPQQAAEVRELCDGVIVGSAIVNCAAAAIGSDAKAEAVGSFTKSLREALDG